MDPPASAKPAESAPMDRLASVEIIFFDGFRLDRGGLFRMDEMRAAAPVVLGSRAFDLLRLLVGRQGELILKNEIMEAVWPATVVEEGNLTVQISALRRVLDQNHPQTSSIQTVPGRGYRFVAPVTRADPAVPPADARAFGNGSCGPISGSGEGQSRSASGPIGSTSSEPAWRARRLRGAGVTVAIVGVLVIVAAWAVWNWRSPPPAETRSAPRLSIVVLPFTNLNDDRDQPYFADGLTDDLTTDLSRLAGMLVISRNTAFTYRNKPVDAKQVGRELGVRYVLEGSVRRSGNQIRINAQLIDADTNAHLWAEHFDRDTGDLFAHQNEITSRIAVTLNLELLAAEAARPTGHPDVLEYIIRGRAAFYGLLSRDRYAEAMSLFEHALALDPQSVEAQSWLAIVLMGRVLDGMADSAAADIARAEGLARQSLATSLRSPLAHFAKAHVLRAQHRCGEAIPEYEAALALNRNWVGALAQIGRCKMLIGRIEEAIPAQEQAIRLSPRDPYLALWYYRIGEAHLLQSRTDEAILWLEKSRSANAELPGTHAALASAYALRGESALAAAELAEARRLNRDGSYLSIARLRANTSYEVSAIRALWETTVLAGLRKAGVPEE
jgi:TolB-like protein/DNA-binding winged helix-turn-helix (wHTH) protein